MPAKVSFFNSLAASRDWLNMVNMKCGFLTGLRQMAILAAVAAAAEYKSA